MLSADELSKNLIPLFSINSFSTLLTAKIHRVILLSFEYTVRVITTIHPISLVQALRESFLIFLLRQVLSTLGFFKVLLG